MPKPVIYNQSFIAGIADSKKAGPDFSFAFNRATDYRSDPKSVTLLPKANKDSGTLVTGLPMWFERACTRTFSYADNGDIYQNTSGTWSKVHTAPDSSGNGLSYFGEDRNLYYAQDETIGRLLEACTGSQFYDGFLESEGGEPTNTRSLDLERGSSEYASVADAAGLSITSDISIEAYLKAESLPGESEEMAILSKWNEQSNQKSYWFGISRGNGYFGDGRDGALTISTNTTEDPVDANCTGTQGEYTLTTSNEHASFSSLADGDIVLIHQSRGTNFGKYQRATVSSYSSNTLTIKEPLEFSPAHSATASDANKAQVRLLKQYTNVTVNANITYTCKAWDGAKGGLMGWLANGTETVNGHINLNGSQGSSISSGTGGGATGGGFRGGNGYIGNSYPQSGYTGESGTGASTKKNTNANNGGGGGAGNMRAPDREAGGGGGSFATTGTNGGSPHASSDGGIVGSIYGASDLSLLQFGSGGGGGVWRDDGTNGGGSGGAAGYFAVDTLTIGENGSITSNGGQSQPAKQGESGAGSGGSLIFFVDNATRGTEKITASAGIGGQRGGADTGGHGGTGRIAFYYLTSVDGTTSPTSEDIEDSSIDTSTGYVIKLKISDDGSAEESYTWDVNNSIETDVWQRWQVTWEDTTSVAILYLNGEVIGQLTGSMTSIFDSTASLAVGANFDSSGTAENFYDGLIDDVRLWNDVRTSSELINNSDRVLYGTESNLVAYYEFESDLTDTTSGSYDLTHSSTATYSNSVPFSGVTSRQDQDQSDGNSVHAGTFTLETTISESAEDRATFVPDYDPQKSIIIKINTVGTGDWTVTIHDALNREVASKTVSNSELYTGFYEFVFDSQWRPVVGSTYHIHVTSTVADGVINVKTGETTIGSSSDSSAFLYFTTHFGVLVNDEYHPMTQFTNLLVIGNERYLATLEGGDVYKPNRLTLPSGFRIRCLAFWREYLVMGVWQGTNITDYDKGWLFFWDGVSSTYNYYIPVPEGGINTLFGTRDILYVIAGYTGELLQYTGGGTAEKIKQIPNLESDEYIEFAPGSMTMWRTLLTFGANLLTDSTNVHQGVYTYGTKNASYPDSLGFSYPLSLGDQVSTDVKIGSVYPSGQNLYIGWQNGNKYGIDKISVTNSPYSTGTIELLIKDLGKMGKDYYPLTYRADFEPLNSGESITLKYKSDRESQWQELVVEDTENATEARGSIQEQNKELQLAVDLKTTTSTSPKLLSVALELDTAAGERNA